MALDFLYLQHKLVELEDYCKKHAGEVLPLVCSECYAIDDIGSCVCESSEWTVFESAIADISYRLWVMRERRQLVTQ